MKTLDRPADRQADRSRGDDPSASEEALFGTAHTANGDGRTRQAGISINLMPWRERRRERRTRRFKQALVLTLLLGLLVGWGVAQHEQALLRAQQARIAMIERHTQSLSRDIEAVRDFRRLRERMLSQIELITQLQASRPLTVRVFDQLAATLVDGVVYTELDRREQTLEIGGIASANRQVSAQMRALAQSDVFATPLLSDVQSGDGPNAPKQFHMSVDERTASDAPAEVTP
ncbi:PilN domain-containing protein [Salinicola halophilus]|uniref:PilN domain-containing protein n=1 Tax=Salinicola halophilus TaxID=184065 RepID=UPI001EF888EF|nr:PilN domain-containing protein [Salinicola halophilus]